MPLPKRVAALSVLPLLMGCGAGAQTSVSGPQLIVMISVDQMRGDLFERYAPAFDAGFLRLREQGFRYLDATHDHAITHTAAGHASLSTGTFPSHSGIVANNWQEKRDGQWVSMYAVEDPDSPILGHPEMGGRSPRNMLRGGLADWVLAADPQARVVSVSGKDRAAITMAGKTRGEVYWLNFGLGQFITSKFYRDEYPEWVTQFNETRMPEFTSDTIWSDSVPQRFRSLARPDEAPYEGDGIHTVFPHLESEEVAPDAGDAARNTWRLRSPRADDAVLALATEAVRTLALGQRGHVDYLGVALSATDYVGHAYGPLSQEQLANLVSLDRALGEFFNYLDDTVGEGRWAVGLSADHGVLTMPEYLAEQGDTDAVRVSAAEVQSQLVAAAQAADMSDGAPEETAERLVKAVSSVGVVAAAYTRAELARGEAPDSFAVFYQHSYFPGRAAGPLSRFGVELRFKEKHLVSRPTGTTHGSPYYYDRHVPFVLMGPGISPGSSEERVRSVDLAPTLAVLAGVPVPDGIDGKTVIKR